MRISFSSFFLFLASYSSLHGEQKFIKFQNGTRGRPDRPVSDYPVDERLRGHVALGVDQKEFATFARNLFDMDDGQLQKKVRNSLSTSNEHNNYFK